MTLSRQLYLLLTLLLFLVFIGTFAISLDNNRDYLAKQLASTAEDTATSLGLSVSTHLAEKDTATLQSMIDAVFDRGYYRLISLQDTSGKTVHERSLPIVIEKVPPWFIGLFPLETPEAEAQVMKGWNQAGILKVASHPGYAYDELWRNAQETLIWFLACAVLGLLLGSLLLRLILKPLRAVEKQAQSICDREYLVQHSLPWTRELRQVVEAMNRMSSRVGQMFAEQAALTEQLQKDVYVDPVTELANRKQFDAQMKHLLQSPDQFTESTLILIQLVDFKGYNDRKGYEAGDEWLRRVAEVLRKICTGQARLISRLSGADFAVLTHVRDLKENNQLAERILDRLKSMNDDPEGADGIAHIGLAACRVGQPLNTILANADLALRQAQQAGPDQYCYAAESSQTSEVTGASQWRERLLGYLENETLLLHVQPVADGHHKSGRLHHEVLLRAREPDGSLTSAGAFMAMAERTGLAQALDRRVIELAVELIDHSQGHLAPLAINLTPSSVDDGDFVTWLLDLVKTRKMGPKLIFEMSEYGVVRFHDSVSQFAKRLRQQGGRFAIDHFGSRLTAFSYLREIRVSYVKLDGSYTRGIEQNKENQVFVRALSRMAHELDIQVIAESVETAAEAQALANLNVDGLQGYHIGKPAHPDF